MHCELTDTQGLTPRDDGSHDVSGSRVSCRFVLPEPVSGWVRVELELHSTSVALVAPVLVVGSPRPTARIRLVRTDSGGSKVVNLPPGTTSVGVELPAARSVVRIGGLGVRPLGQVGATAAMVDHYLRRAVADPDFRSRLPSHAKRVLSRSPRSVVSDPRALLRDLATSYANQFESGARHAGGVSYTEWRDAFAVLEDADRARLRRRIDELVDPPTISVVLPAHETPAPLLRAAIDSVRAQLYPHWQLCAVDDGSTAAHVWAELQAAAESDDRIVVARRDRSGHISAASNRALELATGEFVALLDHDDELPEYALAAVALSLAEDPDADLVYTDEDKIDERGRHYDAHFKPDWNPELFASQNYLGHLVTLRRSVVDEVGGFREGYEGSQDYDLLLRCIERTPAERIRHLPLIGYHWRSVAGSTARDTGQKSYAEPAAVRALTDHLERTGVAATVRVGVVPTTYRVDHALSDPAPRVTVVIPTRNRVDLLRTCIDSLETHTDYRDLEVLVVDNGSDEPDTLAYLEELADTPGRRVHRHDGPFNYARINNEAVALVDSALVCLMNNDIEAIDGAWLTHMVRHAVRPEIGAVGAKLLYPDRTVQHGGVILGIQGVAGHGHKGFPQDHPGYFSRLVLPQALSAVTAACLVVRRESYLAVGGFDEEHLPVAFNDVDFCLRLREAGLRNVWTPDAVLIHHESVSRGIDQTPEQQARSAAEVAYMLTRWEDDLVADPAYNPNLTLDSENFALAPYPRVTPPWAPEHASSGCSRDADERR